MKSTNGISVVIPVRDEEYLGKTLRCLKRAAQGFRMEVIVVVDGGGDQEDHSLDDADFEVRWFRYPVPIGLCPARDWGIEEASFETIFVCDGHMDFEDGMFEWFNTYSLEHPQDVGCGVCRGVDPECWDVDQEKWRDVLMADDSQERTGWSRTLRLGVVLHLLHRDSSGARRIFSSHWVDNSRNPRRPARYAALCEMREHECSSILGANYVLNRSWYLEGMGRPWKGLLGWGTSEQSIALPNWFLGGRNVLLPWQTAHWFRPNGRGVPAERRLHNLLRLFHVLPIGEPERSDMADWLRLDEFQWVPGGRRRVQSMAERLLSSTNTEEYAAFIRDNAKRDWSDWMQAWGDETPEGVM